MKKGKPPKKQKKLAGGPPKLSAYNRFVKRFMKGRKGKATANMKAAAKAWRARGKTRATPRAKPKAKPRAKARGAPAKTGGKRMAGFNQQKLYKLIRLAALASPAIFEAMGGGSMQDKISRIVAAYTGYSPSAGRFDWANLAKGYSPILAATLATYGIPKLAGMIRGI